MDLSDLKEENDKNYNKIVNYIGESTRGSVETVPHQWNCVVYTDAWANQRIKLFNNFTGSVYDTHWKYAAEDRLYEMVLSDKPIKK